MYDFSVQKNMLEVSLTLLEENSIKEVSALGGGTALAAYYWNHRYSTDIDIFIYGKGENIKKLRPKFWSETTIEQMKNIGYDGDFKIHPIYTEFAIDEDSKMQFFDVNGFTDNAYKEVELWGMRFNIESIEEIIAKKIHYRCEKGNTRDLFDIALAIHKEPDILLKINVDHSKIVALYETVLSIKNDSALFEQYQEEIIQMSPSEEYIKLAMNTLAYLSNYLENYIGAYNMGITLEVEELEIIENEVYNSM